MGKAKKEHNRKIAKRNERIKTEQKKFQKQYTQLLEQKMKEFQEKYSKMSGQTQNLTEENTLVTLNGKPLDFTIMDPSELEQNADSENN
jgi:hypothetical protein